MKPALRELQTRSRTISYTLCGDTGACTSFDPALGFDSYVHQLDTVLDRTGVERTALCGVSYGGFIALRYAALRPERVTSLILASSPAPGWVPTAPQQRYVAHPWRSAPEFIVTAPIRLWPEINAAFDTWAARILFAARHSARALAAPIFPPVMARRVRLQQRTDFTPDCAAVEAPTLVVTGEDDLDRIVPTDVTRRYVTLIPGARYARMDRSGHIGILTHPAQFADIVSEFVHQNRDGRKAEG